VVGVVLAGCGGGDDPKQITCADVARSSERTEVLVRALSEEEGLSPEHAERGINGACRQLKPDDKPYSHVVPYLAEEIRRTLGDEEAERFLQRAE
jgi:hypothetical protein